VSRAHIVKRMRSEIARRSESLKELEKDRKFAPKLTHADDMALTGLEARIDDATELVNTLTQCADNFASARTIDAACDALDLWGQLLPRASDDSPIDGHAATTQKAKRGPKVKADDLAIAQHFQHLRDVELLKARNARQQTAAYFEISDGRVAQALKRKPIDAAADGMALPHS
jgi:hypothetical protein